MAVASTAMAIAIGTAVVSIAAMVTVAVVVAIVGHVVAMTRGTGPLGALTFF